MSFEEPSSFLTTVWTRLSLAAKEDRAARDEVARLYWRPIARFVRHRAPELEAEEVAHDVLLTILKPAFLAKADRAKGRFRDLLLAVTRHAVRNAWRKQERAPRTVSFDALVAEPAAPRAERRDFDRLYAQEVLETAIERLRAECKRTRSPQVDVLHLFYRMKLSQPEIAARLDRTEDTVNNHLHRGRARLGELLREVLSLVCSTEEELGEEIGHLFGGWAR